MSHKLIYTLRALLTSVFAFACGLSIGQGLPPVDLGIQAEYMPSHFTAFNTIPVTGTDANGEFVVTIFKASGDTPLPAGSFRVIVSLSPDVPVTDDPITVPSGFSVTKINSYLYHILLTESYTGSGLTSTTREVKFPVQAVAAIPTGQAYNWLVEIQQDEPTYSDPNTINNDAEGRVTVADNALPVKLTTFKATELEGQAYISWATTEEVGFDRFEVQRSLDGKSDSFATVGKVSAKGVNGKGSSYGFTDRDALKGQLLYYRLKMIDRDGVVWTVRAIVLQP